MSAPATLYVPHAPSFPLSYGPGEQRDIQAALDITHAEPPPPGSPLFTLPAAILTRHFAGSVGIECRRHGSYMAEELRRYLFAQPMAWQVTRRGARTMA